MALATADLVQNLTDNTFSGFLKENDMVLVAFVLPFLPVFQRFSREYEEAARVLHGSEVQFAMVDCQKETTTCEQFEFGRWPTVKLFQDSDTIKQYEGAWVASDLILYVRRQTLPIVTTITTDSLRELRSIGSAVVVGVFLPGDDDSLEAFTSVAKTLHEDYIFGVLHDSLLAETEQISRPGIILYKAFDQERITIEPTSDSKAIYDFIKSSGTPSVVEFHPELHSNYVNTGLSLGYVLAETIEARTRLSRILEPLAQKHKDKILLFTVATENFESLADILYLEANALPAFVIKEPARGHRFLLKQRQELSIDVLGTFIEDFITGKLEPAVKSEPVPDTQQGSVVTVVGYTYDDLVINNEKDVLLDYYTQWCGPCKAIAPTYEKLATLYASTSTGQEKITIAKIDAEANDVPGDIRGFPTFKLFPAGAKESSVSYDGPWTIKDFANFVRDNGKYGFDVLIEGETEGSTAAHTEQNVTQKTCVELISGAGGSREKMTQDEPRHEANSPQKNLAQRTESAPQLRDEL